MGPLRPCPTANREGISKIRIENCVDLTDQVAARNVNRR